MSEVPLYVAAVFGGGGYVLVSLRVIPPPPRNTIGSEVKSYCRVLGGKCSL